MANILVADIDEGITGLMAILHEIHNVIPVTTAAAVEAVMSHIWHREGSRGV